MKHIHEIGVYKRGDLRVEVVDLINLEEEVDEKTAVFVGHTTVTRRIDGQDSRDFYRINRAYLKERARWRVVLAYSARVATIPERVAKHVRRAVA